VQNSKEAGSLLRRCGFVMGSKRKHSAALRLLLEKRLADVEADAVRNCGTIPESTMRDLSNLARLVELRDQAASLARRRRWPVGVAFGLTLLFASVLLFTHVHQTEIELHVVLSEVGLVLSVDHPLTDAIELSSLGAAGVDGVTFPLATDAVTRNSLKLKLIPGQQPAQLTLAPIVLPAKSHVWLRVYGVPGFCRISILAENLRLRADVSGHIDVAGTGASMTFVSPTRFLLDGGSREVELELVSSNKDQNPFVQHLPLEAMSMFRVEEFTDGDRALPRKVSSLISGTLYFDSLGGRERKLRQGEALELEQSNGVLQRIALTDGKIILEFHGVVHGIKSGDDGRTDLMPTSLEWLRARHGLYLMWGTALYFFGLVMGVLRWTGVRV
jgi:hypothetical protein